MLSYSVATCLILGYYFLNFCLYSILRSSFSLDAPDGGYMSLLQKETPHKWCVSFFWFVFLIFIISAYVSACRGRAREEYRPSNTFPPAPYVQPLEEAPGLITRSTILEQQASHKRTPSPPEKIINPTQRACAPACACVFFRRHNLRP